MDTLVHLSKDELHDLADAIRRDRKRESRSERQPLSERPDDAGPLSLLSAIGALLAGLECSRLVLGAPADLMVCIGWRPYEEEATKFERAAWILDSNESLYEMRHRESVVLETDTHDHASAERQRGGWSRGAQCSGST